MGEANGFVYVNVEEPKFKEDFVIKINIFNKYFNIQPFRYNSCLYLKQRVFSFFITKECLELVAYNDFFCSSPLFF